jgi:hypothetical protein
MLSACAIASFSNPFRSSEAEPPARSTAQGALPELPEDGKVSDAPEDYGGSFNCPQVVAWPHDRLLTVYAAGHAGDAKSVIHRGEITKLVRECSITGNSVTVKYGIAGRVMLGPKGRGGQVVLPYSVKVSDSERKVLANDSGRFATALGQETPVGYFSEVKQISFSIATGSRPQDYKIYVAFVPRAG